MKSNEPNLEELVKGIQSIASAVYRLIDTLPTSEEWDLQSKLRKHTVEAVSVIGEASGTLDPRDAKWRLSQARGNLQALKSLLKLSYDAHETELDPDLMLLVEASIRNIDKAVSYYRPSLITKWLEDTYPAGDMK